MFGHQNRVFTWAGWLASSIGPTRKRIRNRDFDSMYHIRGEEREAKCGKGFQRDGKPAGQNGFFS
jgi:hypothetical protein